MMNNSEIENVDRENETLTCGNCEALGRESQVKIVDEPCGDSMEDFRLVAICQCCGAEWEIDD